MIYMLAFASGVALIGIWGFLSAHKDSSLLVRVLRSSLKFLVPFFLVAAFYSGLQYWIESTSDVLTATASIHDLETTIAKIRTVLTKSHVKLEGWQELLALAFLFLSSSLFPISERFSLTENFKKALKLIGRAYMVLTLLVSFTFFSGQGDKIAAVQEVKINAQIDKIERGYAEARAELNKLTPEIVAEALIKASGALAEIDRLHVIRTDIQAAGASIDLYDRYLHPPEDRDAIDTFAKTISGRWDTARRRISGLHDQLPGAGGPPSINAGRDGWTEQEAANIQEGINAYKEHLGGKTSLSRDFQEVVKKCVDIVYSPVEDVIKAPLKAALQTVLSDASSNLALQLLSRIVDPIFHDPAKDFLTEASTSLVQQVTVEHRSVREAAGTLLDNVLGRIRPFLLKQSLRMSANLMVDLQQKEEEARRLLESTHMKLQQRLAAADLDIKNSIERDVEERAEAMIRAEQEAGWGSLRKEVGKGRIVIRGVRVFTGMRGDEEGWRNFQREKALEFAHLGYAANSLVPGVWDKVFFEYTQKTPDLAVLWGAIIAELLAERRKASVRPEEEYEFFVKQTGVGSDGDVRSFFETEAVKKAEGRHAERAMNEWRVEGGLHGVDRPFEREEKGPKLEGYEKPGKEIHSPRFEFHPRGR